MPHILPTLDFTPNAPPETTGVARFAVMLRKLYEQLARIVNGQLSFGDGLKPDNIAGVWVTVTTPSGVNTDFTVTHNLLYIPQGFLVISQTKAGIIYLGSVAATNKTITLRCSVASDIVKLFIL